MRRSVLSLACAILLIPLFAEDKAVFTSASENSISISTAEVWYLEECDVLSRPVSGTLWKKGAITERTSWIYESDSQNPAIKIVTNESGSTETAYDSTGNVTGITVTDSAGAPVSKLENSFNADNLLVESVLVESLPAGATKTTKILQEYDADKKLSEKKRFENGELAVAYAYESDDNWTETVYSKSVPVLVVRYENGMRMKDMDEGRR